MPSLGEAASMLVDALLRWVDLEALALDVMLDTTPGGPLDTLLCQTVGLRAVALPSLPLAEDLLNRLPRNTPLRTLDRLKLPPYSGHRYTMDGCKMAAFDPQGAEIMFSFLVPVAWRRGPI